jgi:hypothetical protein
VCIDMDMYWWLLGVKDDEGRGIRCKCFMSKST